MSIAAEFKKDESGIAAVEFGLLSGFIIAVTIGALELGIGYFQYNSVQQAARIGARLAAVSDPVASDMKSMTGLGPAKAGDPMPAYTRTCTGKTRRCSGGTYDAAAMNAIIFGPDNDGACAPTQKARRGICDMQSDITPANVTVTYAGSGLGTAGNPAVLTPLITVKVTDIKFDFFIADAFLPKSITTMPDIEVSVMAEDLRSRS